MEQDKLMTMTIGPDEVVSINRQQFGFAEATMGKKCNCIMLGIAIIQMLDSAGKLAKDKRTGELSFEGLKIYIDGDNEINIAVGLNPFLEAGSRIIL